MAETFPKNWQIAQDFDPNDHIMQLKGRDYLNVQARLLWFIRDQRALIVAGLAKVPYVVQTDLVEQDRQQGYAHFKTFVRDVLGNETTMYGSESAKDFGDYAEKASTKSLGRALLCLGYGTNFAPEMDEGDRVVDSPVERKQERQERRGAGDQLVSDATWARLQKACETMGRPQPNRHGLSEALALSTIEQLTDLYKKQQGQPANLRQLATGTSRP